MKTTETRAARMERMRAWAQTDECKRARRRWLVLGLASPINADEHAFVRATFKVTR